MPAKSRLCTLSVLKFHYSHPLYCFFAYTKQTGCHLSNNVVIIGLKHFRVSSLTGTGKGIPYRSIVCFGKHGGQTYRTEGHTTAIDRRGNDNICPTVISAV